MKYIKWKKSYESGNENIDNQHKQFFLIFNKLYEIKKENNFNNKLFQVISDLIDYTIYHFSFEEELMKKINFPEYNEHKKKHTIFQNRILEIREKFFNNEIKFTDEMVTELYKWLSRHILKEDKKIIYFINKKTVK